MKKSEIKVTVTFRQILDAPSMGSWDDMCEKYGINEWCINEGRASDQDEIEVSLADAEKWGLIEEDEQEGGHFCPYCDHKEMLINAHFTHIELEHPGRPLV